MPENLRNQLEVVAEDMSEVFEIQVNRFQSRGRLLLELFQLLDHSGQSDERISKVIGSLVFSHSK